MLLRILDLAICLRANQIIEDALLKRGKIAFANKLRARLIAQIMREDVRVCRIAGFLVGAGIYAPLIYAKRKMVEG